MMGNIKFMFQTTKQLENWMVMSWEFMEKSLECSVNSASLGPPRPDVLGLGTSGGDIFPAISLQAVDLSGWTPGDCLQKEPLWIFKVNIIIYDNYI